MIVAELFRRGATITAYDPVAMDKSPHLRRRAAPHLRRRPMRALDGADALVIVTEVEEFRNPDFDAIEASSRAVIFDGRNIFDPRFYGPASPT